MNEAEWFGLVVEDEIFERVECLKTKKHRVITEVEREAITGWVKVLQ